MRRILYLALAAAIVYCYAHDRVMVAIAIWMVLLGLIINDDERRTL